MKTQFLLPLLAFALMGHALAQPIVTVPAANRDLTIVLPRTGNALVRDVRQVELPAGRVQLALPGLVQGFNSESFQLSLDPDARVLGRPNVPDDILQNELTSFVGQTVTLIREGDHKPIVGKLLGTAPVLLETSEGVLLDPPGFWQLPAELIRGVQHNSPAPLLWSLQISKAGTYRAESNYNTNSLGWSINYAARLSSAHDHLKLTANLFLSNHCYFDWRDAKIYLAGVGQVPTDALLIADNSRVVWLDHDFAVQQTRFFTRPGDFLGAFTNQHPALAITSTETFDRDLPTGTLTLWSQDEAGLPQQQVFNDFSASKAQPLNLSFGADENVFIDRYIVSNKLLNPVTREITIAWRVSTRQNGLTLSINDQAPDRYKLTDSTLKPDNAYGNILVFKLSPSVGDQTEFRYTVDVPA